MKPLVSLWILVARTDVPYMEKTIPHLIRSCNYPFVEKVIAMDTKPLTGDKRYRYKTGNQEELEIICQNLVERGIIDKVVKIDYDPAKIKDIYYKYFGVEQGQKMLNHTHNWKGSTVYASLYCIETSATDYYLHFDADMLLYQDKNFDWITKAINLMDSIPEIAIIRPLCGPPHPQGMSFHPNSLIKDQRGFFAHKFFSMRAYLISRQRFSQLSPIPLMWKYLPLWSRKLPKSLQNFAGKIESRLRGKKGLPLQGAIASFEPMTSKKLQSTNFVRADLCTPEAWTIHPPDHSPDFMKFLSKIIEKVEAGEYPLQQGGHYDLMLQEWINFLKE